MVVILWNSAFFLYCLKFCGEAEDVVRAVTPVVGGVVQVFHDVLVEHPLQLVVKVEEREKVRTRLELEPNVSVDKVYETSETPRTFSGTVCGGARCEAPRNQLSTSSLVFVSSCCPSRLLLSIFSSQFTSYCCSSLPVAIFHMCFHCILTAVPSG